MTALVRGDAVVVPVALGSRSYEIVIGRGVIATLGTRIAALRPGAKVFIVTDENVAAHAMTAAQTALKRAGIASGQMIVPPGEPSKPSLGGATTRIGTCIVMDGRLAWRGPVP